MKLGVCLDLGDCACVGWHVRREEQRCICCLPKRGCEQWGEAWTLKSSGMPRRGAASGTSPGTVHGRVPPCYSPIHQPLALLYLKDFCEHLLVFPLLGWATFPCCYGASWPGGISPKQVASLNFFFPPPSLMSGLSDTSGIVWCYGDTALLCYRICSVRSGRCGWGEAGDLEILQEGPAGAGCLGRDQAPLCFLVESWPGLSDSECGHGRSFILYYKAEVWER